MALVLITPNRDTSGWVRALHALEPELDVRVWPEVGDRRDIVFAVTWQHPPGELSRYPNLRCVSSLGAGVDHIVYDPDLPKGVAVTRVVDPALVQSMTEYVVTAVLFHHRRFGRYLAHQSTKKWLPEPSPRLDNARIGILGLGKLGGAAARALVQLGFDVAGWSRTAKSMPGVESFSGEAQFDQFLARTNILICLLPLTPQTRDILNRDTFSKLQPGAYIINVARGEHLVEEDLLEALDRGLLSGACLDVFRTEPLPAEHPFWTHPKILVTPHIASVTDPESAAVEILENYRRLQSGEALLNQVDRSRGY